MNDLTPPEHEVSQKPTPKDFVKAIAAVGEYNKQFGFGGLFSRTISHSIEQSLAEGPITADTKSYLEEHFPRKVILLDPLKTTFDREKSVGGTLLDLKISSETQRLGLAVQPARANGSVTESNGAMTKAGEARLTIADKGKFIGFLEGLSEEQAHDAEVQDALLTFSWSLISQVNKDVNLKDPSEADLNTIASLSVIASQCQRLGLGENEAVQQLTKMGKYANEHCLREYVEAQNASMLSRGEGFGPRNWHTDGAVDRWDNVLEIFERLKTNPNAANLVTEVRASLLTAANGALDDLHANKYPWVAGRADDELRPLFKRIIVQVSE